MPTPKNDSHDAFSAFFARAEKSQSYWIERAKIEFTEEIVARLKELGMNKTKFAEALEVSPAMVTRIVSGQNNFELATMVKIARVLDCEYRSHLQRPGTISDWIAFSVVDPKLATQEEEEEKGWGQEYFEETYKSQMIAHVR